MVEGAVAAIRRSARIFVHVPAEIVVDSEGTHVSYPAATVELSAHGARVQTNVALVPGERVGFIWRGATPRQFPCQVVWSGQAQSDRSPEAGLEFLEPIQASA
jgi:PilZ domain